MVVVGIPCWATPGRSSTLPGQVGQVQVEDRMGWEVASILCLELCSQFGHLQEQDLDVLELVEALMDSVVASILCLAPRIPPSNHQQELQEKVAIPRGVVVVSTAFSEAAISCWEHLGRHVPWTLGIHWTSEADIAGWVLKHLANRGSRNLAGCTHLQELLGRQMVEEADTADALQDPMLEACTRWVGSASACWAPS